MAKDSPETDGKKMITMDLDTLNALIAEKVSGALQTSIKDNLEPLEKRMAEAAALNALPQKEVSHACESLLTGSTFTARVVSSKSFPRGRIVDLLDYTHPASASIYQADGGQVPNGAPLDGIAYKMWKYNEFWKRDLLDLVGKPFSDRYLASNAAAIRSSEGV